ncbi:hypothetical protein [Sphingobium xenophagum]|uniref:hypothetical protein n=1 Tax=Sphingobium xenophagum TaxID=121428 RepID=UPI0002E18628|nr:hypothetical protein [Sphingobium xenophagum]QWT16926.1 hypothetical protein GTV57_21745 [Sphingobium xenophagum]
MKRKVILVLGMHRSGTSALTRTLSFLGCDLPQNLVPETPDNPTGHWEPNILMNFNNEILNSAGSNWDDWLEFNQNWYNSPNYEYFFESAPEILSKEYQDSPLFLLKDPRNCRLTRFWFNVFDQQEIETLAVLPLRNPLEVAASLETRDGIHRDHAMLLWLRHVLDAERGSRGRRRFFATYEELLQNWSLLAERMQDAFDITWPKSIANAAQNMAGFLSADNRHHVRSTHMLTADPTASQWVRNVYHIMAKWAHDGENISDHPTLDRIRDEFNAAGPAFSQLVRDIGSARQTELALRAQLAAEQEELSHARESHISVSEQQTEQLAHHVAHAQQLQEQYDALANDLAQQRAHEEALAAALSQEQAERSSLDELLAQRDAACAALTQQLVESQADAAAQREALAAALSQEQAERSSLDELLAQRDAACAALTQQLVESQADAAAQREALTIALAREQGVRDELAQIVLQRDETLQSLADERTASEASLTAENQRLHQQILQQASLQNQLEQERSDLAHELREMKQSLEETKTALAIRQHDLATARSMLRQREEEIHQTLSNFEKMEKQNVAARDAADQQLKTSQAKLKAADEWVFRLAGDRKLAEDQAAMALKRVAMAEKASADLAAQIINLEQENLSERQKWNRQREEMDRATQAQAALLDQERAEVQRWQTARADAVKQVEALTQSLDEKGAETDRALAQIAHLRAQSVRQRKNAEQLSERLSRMEVEAKSMTDRALWLQQVNAVVTGYPQWWGLLPRTVQDKWRHQRLRRRGLFDAEAYLSRYPDVVSSGMSPLRHYILHGMAENRTI